MEGKKNKDLPVDKNVSSLLPSAGDPTEQYSFRGRKLLENIPTKSLVLKKMDPCRHCNAKKFEYETENFCCSGGKVVLASNKIPLILIQLITGVDDEAKQFRNCIRTYNNHLAFTSLGVKYDKDLAKRNKGIYTFRVQGQMYHFINDLDNERKGCKNLQFYFHDTTYEINNRMQECPRLLQPVLQKLLLVLSENPYARFFRGLRFCPNLEEREIVLYCNPELDQRVYNKPTVPQVAAIIEDSNHGEHETVRSINVYTHSGQSRPIQYYYGCFDPTQYPLLFPKGEIGWHQGICKKGVRINKNKRKRDSDILASLNPCNAQDAEDFLQKEKENLGVIDNNSNNVSIREYYAYKFQMRDNDESYLLHFGRLFQQFSVDMFIKMETQRLDYYSSQQTNIRSEFLQGMADALAAGENSCGNVGHRVVLPATFVGGPRHMRRKYLDAMTLVQKYGKPDLFITMTCNPNWSDIKDHLLENEEPQDRPDLAIRAFHSRLEELKKDLFKKNIFGEVAAFTYVIEFQKRGLPHAHFLLILKPQFKLYKPEEFDRIVSAELPDKKKYPHLYALVVKHMLHGPCGPANPTNVCMKEDGTCRNSFPKEYCSETMIGSDEYPTYMRRCDNKRVKVRGAMLDNRWVIPYNAYLLAKYDCHINVEICSTIKAVKYIYKYICKGNDRVMFNVSDGDKSEVVDEIKDYVSGRWVSAPEALWRIYRMTMGELKPAVIHLQLHLENHQPLMFNKNKKLVDVLGNPFSRKTMLTEYFTTNRLSEDAQRLNCTYNQFPDHFVWLPDKKKWQLRQKGNSVGRVVLAKPTEGERYYLRILLMKVHCPKSFEDLRTVNYVLYNSYHEAALQRGLLKADNTQEMCLEEACTFGMPYELRRLFATLLVYSCPNEPKKLWFRFQNDMTEDFTKRSGFSGEQGKQLALTQINSFLLGMGKNINMYGIVPHNKCFDDNADLTREVRAEKNIVVSGLDLSSQEMLNKEQKEAFDQIINSIYSNSPGAFFIDGPGGTGKTFLYRALLANVRSKGFIALATATSGIAASLLPGGRTAHSRFKIPIDLTENPSCRVNKQSSVAALIKESKLIIWDEAPMSKKKAIEALDELLQDIMDTSAIFGGKVVVLGGDFRGSYKGYKITNNKCITD